MGSDVYVLRAGESEKFGPFELIQVADMLCQGELNNSDLFWREGMPSWETLDKFPIAPAPLEEVVAATVRPARSAAKIVLPTSSLEQRAKKWLSHFDGKNWSDFHEEVEKMVQPSVEKAQKVVLKLDEQKPGWEDIEPRAFFVQSRRMYPELGAAPVERGLKKSGSMNLEWPQWVGFIAGALMVLGVFLPLVSAPMVGSVTWFNSGRGDGTIVLVIGAGVMFCSLLKFRFAIVLGGVAVGALLIYFYVNFQAGMEEARERMSENTGMFSGLGKMMVDAVQIQFGAVVLAGAAVAAIVAGVVTSSRR
jgi:hypothetical protein